MQGRPRVVATLSLEEELEIWTFRIGLPCLLGTVLVTRGPGATTSPRGAGPRCGQCSEAPGPVGARGAVLWLRQGRHSLYPHTEGSCEEALWPGEVRGALRPQADEAHFPPEPWAPGAPSETTD